MSEELALYFPQSGERFSLKEKGTIIAGRSKEKCTLVLAKKEHFPKGLIKSISRKHFKIYKKGRYSVIEDLGSAGGTEVDGKKLLPGIGITLHPNSKIRLVEDNNFFIEIIDYQSNENDPDETNHEEEKTVIPDFKRILPPRGVYFEKHNEGFFVDGQPIHHLPPVQESLLMYLYKNIERRCSYWELNQHVWHGTVTTNTVQQGVKKLRDILNEASPEAGRRYIKTITGYGYKLTQK